MDRNGPIKFAVGVALCCDWQAGRRRGRWRAAGGDQLLQQPARRPANGTPLMLSIRAVSLHQVLYFRYFEESVTLSSLWRPGAAMRRGCSVCPPGPFLPPVLTAPVRLACQKVHLAGERCCGPRGRKLNCFHQLLRNETRTTADHIIKEAKTAARRPLRPLGSHLSPASWMNKRIYV
ncbi:hypothetical protein E2C01_082661 [Portunus trituberculatus]|uniref:Uncharacterized protein n=1 Tax=Portunus trituberculatus TaxID=210409 RepID=A0A5B7J4D6_PORTR|nr:hypothetical protein [Portunus trituberculatus]